MLSSSWQVACYLSIPVGWIQLLAPGPTAGGGKILLNLGANLSDEIYHLCIVPIVVSRPNLYSQNSARCFQPKIPHSKYNSTY